MQQTVTVLRFLLNRCIDECILLLHTCSSGESCLICFSYCDVVRGVFGNWSISKVVPDRPLK